MTKDIPAFAFPIDSDIDINRDQPWCGMTLRDYFAGQAMQGLIPQFRAMFMDGSIEGCWVGDTIPELTKEAYVVADAMMKAREA